MNNDKLAEEFSRGATKGKGSSMFIEGNAIFSYGYHFPIAVRVEGADVQFLFNEDRYSNTTGKHKFNVRHALRGSTYREVTTETIKQAVNTNQKYDFENSKVIVLQREPETLEELFNSMVLFLKKNGVKRISVSNKEKLLNQIKALQLGEAL